MYFQTYNHQDFAENYDIFKKQMDEKNDEKEKDNETNNTCIVCLERTDLKLSEMKFKNHENQILQKNCSCECYAHNECLNVWILTKESCPICRDKLNIYMFDDTFYGYPFILFYFSNENTFINKFNQKIYAAFEFFKRIYFYLALTFVLNINYKIISIVVKNLNKPA
jgi:hypothetical protein